VHPRLYVLAGHEVTPAVGPEVLAEAFGLPVSQALFVGRDARAVAVDEAAFVPLEAALLEAPVWAPSVAETIAQALDDAPLDLKAASIGWMPLRGVEPPAPEE
jgi:hypothetical protein